MIAGSIKVVLDPPPADTVGSSSMTITAALALFAALWDSVLKRKESRLKQVRYKIKTAKLKNYKSTKVAYSSSSSSELSAERSKSGSLPGAVAVAREDPTLVAAATWGAPAATLLAAVERVARLGCY